MNISDIKLVLIAGAGTMGQQIGTQCALHGYRVIYCDIQQEILDRAEVRIDKLLDYFVKHKAISQDAAQTARALISMTTTMEEAAAQADLVSESVPEDPEVKGRLFARLNTLCPTHTIFTTNTSTLLPSQFADISGRPERLLALHFHDTRVTNIVDVMPHGATLPAVRDLVIEFAESIGQVPIVLQKESSGYVFNAMLSAWFQAAQTLAANGITSVEEIDRAWMGVTRMALGPFAMMDSVGIDTVWKVTDHWARELNDPQYAKNAAYLKTFIDHGLLGQKTGNGFYKYPEPVFKRPDFVRGGQPENKSEIRISKFETNSKLE